MRLPSFYRFSSRPRIISGEHALERLPYLLDSLHVSNPIILSDKGLEKAGLVGTIIEALGSDEHDQPPVFTDIPPDSDLRTVNTIAAAYRDGGCDGIIALGGGSVIDTAKGVNIVVSLSGKDEEPDLRRFAGADIISRELRPLVVLPTTSGTGSESTLVAVIKDHERKRKMLFTSPFIQPSAALLDPALTVTLPAHITAATGMDALTHAIEAYTGLGKNPLSDGLALEAIRLILENLEHAVKHPKDTESRLALAVGSNLAGQAFSNSMVGIVHMVGHTVGSICGVHHGLAMSILLPYGLEYNLHKIRKELTDLSFCFFGEPRDAEEMITAIRDLNDRLNRATAGKHVTRLHDVTDRAGGPAVRPDHLDLIACEALGDGSHFYNPEQVSCDDVRHILQAAYWGYPLDRALIQQGHA